MKLGKTQIGCIEKKKLALKKRKILGLLKK